MPTRPRLSLSAPTGAPSFEAIFETHRRWVKALATRLSRRADEADDIVQDVFLLYSRKLDTIGSWESAKAWLRTVTVRVVRERRRRTKWLAWFSSDAGSIDAIPDPSPSPEERAVVEAFHRSLSQLPEAQKLAWVLRHVEGNALDDVARACECSLATAKRRIDAAKRHLEDLRSTEELTESGRSRSPGA